MVEKEEKEENKSCKNCFYGEVSGQEECVVCFYFSEWVAIDA